MLKYVATKIPLRRRESSAQEDPIEMQCRYTIHFYRNVFSVTPRLKVKLVAKMLKAIHTQESRKISFGSLRQKQYIYHLYIHYTAYGVTPL